MLPNLLVVGAMRSGTTSVYRYLSEHPEIFMSPDKEPHFFAFEGARPAYTGPGDDRLNRRVVTTLEEYESLFARGAGSTWRGEASAMYLYLERSIESMRRHGVDPLVVVLLRNPADRAFSGYQYMRRQGREPISTFEDALEAESARIAANWSPMWHYRRAGLYASSLAAYRDAFGPGKLHVILSDDLERDTAGTLRALFVRLGVDAAAPIDYGLRHNRSGKPRSALLQDVLSGRSRLKRRLKRMLPHALKRTVEQLREQNVARVPGMSRQTRARLSESFADDVELTARLLGRDLSHWLRARGDQDVTQEGSLS